MHTRIGFSCRGGFSAVVLFSPPLYLSSFFLQLVQHQREVLWGVHSIKKVECSGRGRVDVFTCKDRITKVVPWSILGGTSVQRIGTKDEEGSI
jgi:hypothetical protein